MAAPVVQSIQDLVAQIGAAYKPQLDNIDQSISSNEQSGQAQKSGLDATQAQQFGKITQGAQDKGMLFSGFAPDAQAKYTGSTYMPALAKLQSTIAATRDTLLGKKADIAATANSQAFTENQNQVRALDSYNQAQEAAAAAARQHAADQAFQASENAKNRAATQAAAATRAASQQPKAVTGYGVSTDPNSGGYRFHGPNGQPVSVGAYLNAISGGQAGTADLAQILSGSGSKDDQKIAADIINNKLNSSQVQKKYSWLYQ